MRRSIIILVLCVGCADARNPVAPPAAAPPQARTPLAMLSCSATIPRPGVITGITCRPTHARSAAAGSRSARAEDVIVGRQNVDVTLKFTGTTFTSSLVSTNATVTNLLSQPMGTTDGATTTVNGVEVFFVLGPTDIWSVGAAGAVLHFDGAARSAQTSGVSSALRGVYAAAPGTAAADVYAVGDNGVVLHSNGASSTSWLTMPAPAAVSTNQFLTVFGTSTTNVYVGGANGVVMVGTQ